MTSFEQELQKATEYLVATDPLLGSVINRVGLCTIRPHQNYYWELVDSIISQQLSVKAAASIERRFQELFASDVPTPEQILKKSHDELRSVGLSNAKANYIRDLAEHIIDGRLTFQNIQNKSNDEIAAMLIDVKGIGVWTVHMFLMFSMGRLDVLPIGDLGIRNGVRALYGFKDAPTPEQVTKLAKKNKWHPYESVASWYIWQSLDNAPAL